MWTPERRPREANIFDVSAWLAPFSVSPASRDLPTVRGGQAIEIRMMACEESDGGAIGDNFTCADAAFSGPRATAITDTHAYEARFQCVVHSRSFHRFSPQAPLHIIMEI
jgi:hypothetical protein